MNARATVICPMCASRSCRESRWLSREEKNGNAGSHPHRCLDCGHRFLFAVPSRSGARRALPILVAVLTLGLAGVLLVGALGTNSDNSYLESLDYRAANDSGLNDGATNPSGTAALSDMEKLLAAARQGDADAQFRVGRNILLDHSRGAEGADEAVAWLRQAADQGHAGAMLQLGKLYRSGIGLPQNFALAAQWIQAAARTGHDDSMVELGRLYRSGIGVERDPIQAYIWFNRAAAARNLEGAAERDSIALKLTTEELHHAQQQSLSPSAPPPSAPAPSDEPPAGMPQ